MPKTTKKKLHGRQPSRKPKPKLSAQRRRRSIAQPKIKQPAAQVKQPQHYIGEPMENPLFNAVVGTVVLILLYLLFTSILAGISYLAYGQGLMSQNTYSFVLYVASLIPLTISVLVYLIIYKKLSLKEAWDNIGLNIGRLTFRIFIMGVLIFAIVFCLEIAVNIAAQATNVQINTNVQSAFAGAPLWFYFFASVIEPINEEIFFRGFLSKRIGILPSSILFGLAHYSYNSTFGIEIIAAFIFGTMAAYIFKKTGSLYPGIIAHIGVNTLASLSILFT